MPTLLIIVTIALYIGAAVLWVRFHAYRYLVVLLAGQLTVLFDPLWQRIYAINYPAAASDIGLWGRSVPLFMLFSASWMATLPALALYFSQRRRWWPRHYLSGIMAFVALMLYHLILQGIARRTGLWSYGPTVAAWGLNYDLFLAMLGALVSLLIFYILVATRYYAVEIAVPTFVAAIVLMPVVVYGILGAPFWLSGAIDQSTTVRNVGAIITLLLVGWVTHVACWGIHSSRKQLVISN